LSKHAPSLKITFRRTILPMIAVLTAIGGAMAYYFFRTTGSVFNTPYIVNVNQYFVVPNFPVVSA